MNETLEALTCLWPLDIPEGLEITIGTIKPKPVWSHHSTIAEAAQAHADIGDNDQTAYFSVAAMRAGLASHEKGTLDDVRAVPAVFVDLDRQILGTKNSGLPHSHLDALIRHLCASPVKPGLIVNTCGGFHVYSLLDEPAMGDDLIRVADLNRRWRRFVQDACTRLGFRGRVDGLQNLDRVLRLPGSIRAKGDALDGVATIHRGSS